MLPDSSLTEDFAQECLKGIVLKKSFFDRPTPIVACDLLGKVLVHETRKGILAGMIVETEAYLGAKDPACHASAGRTERTRMFYQEDPAGTVYVFSMRIYSCLNVLTSGDEPAGCVLLRAVEPLLGIDIMRRNRKAKNNTELTSGPGKLTEAFDISKVYNGHSITDSPLKIMDCNFNNYVPSVTIRVGISKAWQYPLRYILPDSPFVSRTGLLLDSY
ncbi:MAG: DNA-3-methyladenine glycosylase [Thaumarchaeota archaeon]|nr:DNA-3-methyladenine glycosylase [Nitrososphaerota archaeon]